MKLLRVSNSRLFCFALVAASILSSGCVSNTQYRTNYQASRYNERSTNTANAVIEIAANYTLGFVEFDDQGWLWNRKQIDAITQQVTADMETNGVLMVTFVHGWKHNASAGDGNVKMFHTMLRQLAVVEQRTSKKPRRVVGVYVGWRGLSQSTPYINNFSFWERKGTAEQVGHGAVIELLAELEKQRNQSNGQFKHEIESKLRKSTKLIVIGHSFGGDVVYSAVAPLLIERMVENVDGAGQPRPPRGVGDLVVLVNPAFEAARFETLKRLGSTRTFPASTNCILAIFTSTADNATGVAFPAGRHISTLFDAYRDKEQRSANLTAVGHYLPYITYNLAMLDKSGKANEPTAATSDAAIGASGDKVRSLKEQLGRASKTSATIVDSTYTFTHCQLSPTPTCVRNDPIFNVAVDPRIIPDHNAIDNWVFIRFLVEFISAFSGSGDE